MIDMVRGLFTNNIRTSKFYSDHLNSTDEEYLRLFLNKFVEQMRLNELSVSVTAFNDVTFSKNKYYATLDIIVSGDDFKSLGEGPDELPKFLNNHKHDYSAQKDNSKSWYLVTIPKGRWLKVFAYNPFDTYMFSERVITNLDKNKEAKYCVLCKNSQIL